MSGYDLTKAFESSLAFVWAAQHSQIYPELKRLNDEGLIQQVEEGPRGRKTYAITGEGKTELHNWLVNVKPDRTIRDERAVRIFFLWQLKPEEAIAYLDNERAQEQAELERFEEIYRDIRAGKSKPPWGTLPVQLGISLTSARLMWTVQAIGEFRRRSRKRKGSSTRSKRG